MVCLVLIETSGNQQFIFATNRLRENVGASQLTLDVGTSSVMSCLRSAVPGTPSFGSPREFRAWLGDLPGSATLAGGSSVEPIMCTSGKALLLASSQETGRRIVQEVTRKALSDAPGLHVSGALVETDLAAEPVSAAIRRLHEEHERVRWSLAGPAGRMLRLPVIEECATSGLPAEEFDEDDLKARDAGKKGQPKSAVSVAKERAAREAMRRMGVLRSERGEALHLASKTDDLAEIEDSLDWLGVIHADGNGLGALFLKFHRAIGVDGPEGNEHYIDQLRKFSVALDACAERVFCEALLEQARTGLLQPRLLRDRRRRRWLELWPVVPIVLGGDDLTLICAGELAIPLARTYLEKFEEVTGDPEFEGGIISKIAQGGGLGDHLSACAGIAVVKPHFPFHAAYGLAGKLADSAKRVKQKMRLNGAAVPCSALDFHLHHDSSGADLNEIRARMVPVVDDGRTRLFRRPYVVTPSDNWQCDDPGKAWAAPRQIDWLIQAARALQARDASDGRRLLPNTLTHELREGLFVSRDEADARLRLILHRYPGQELKSLLGSPETLFLSVADVDDKNSMVTGLIDAMEYAELTGGDA